VLAFSMGMLSSDLPRGDRGTVRGWPTEKVTCLQGLATSFSHAPIEIWSASCEMVQGTWSMGVPGQTKVARQDGSVRQEKTPCILEG
jgi:hypothetical protein